MTTKNVIIDFVKLVIRGTIPFKKSTLLSLVLLASFSALIDIGGLAVLIILIQKSITQQLVMFSADWTLNQILLVLLLVYLIKALTHVLIYHFMIIKVFDINSKLALSRYEQASYKMGNDKASMSASNLLHELNALIFSMSNGILVPFITLLAEVVVLIGLFTLLIWFYPILSLILVLVLAPFSLFIWWFNQRVVKSQSRQLDKTHRSLFKSILEFINGHNELRMNNLKSAHADHFSQLMRTYFEIRKRFQLNHAQLPFRFMEFLAVVCLFALLFFSPEDSERLLTITVFGGAAFRIIPSVNRIIGSHASMQINAHVLQFVQKEKGVSSTIVEDNTSNYSLNKGIKLINLSFTYPNQVEPVFENINAEVKVGEILGVSGNSGSGKSTLLHILAGLNAPSKGHIFIDKQELLSKQVTSYYPLVAYVEQKSFIMEGTIMANVGYADHFHKIDKEKVWHCLEESDLLTWVNSLPHGIYTSIGEGGGNISGGQIKRLALARALYKGASLFLLDEISSGLDEQSEKEILKTIHRLKKKGKLILIASHSSNVLEQCDRVLYL